MAAVDAPGWERRLQARVRALLPDGDEILAAIPVLTGPRPGSEVLAVLLAPLGLVASLFGVALVARRRYFTIAVTGRSVLLIENRSPMRPKRVVERAEYAALGPFNEATGDLSVNFNGSRYWMTGNATFVTPRIRRLLAAGGSRSD